MALDVKIETDDSDASLDMTVTFRNVMYEIGGNRGIQTYPLKLLKAFQTWFEAIVGTFAVPPTIMLDFGSTIETISLVCYLKGVGSDPVDNVESQIQTLREFFCVNCGLAEYTKLYIGTQLHDLPYVIGYSNDFIEGKVNKYKFKWVSKEFAIVRLDIEYVPGIDLEIF